ncbi:hypothetical protein [Myroides odoratus]|uniref:Uncharacterized protein n=1 Tax=Myroides odoratus TaxID=256 RepID=A0A378RLB2_MYROD|nr:hypothetical protein [Myroides odoratus]QQU04748.1 hypothetical protein I6I89_05515 [Myroides odoratus]STZ27806.1 Uncharacterised protein [Myroides odoratus]
METKFQLLKEQKFPENLEKKLISSITDKQVTTIWYGRVYNLYNTLHNLKVLWLRVKDKEEVTKVFSKEYIKALLEDKNTHIVLLDDNDFELQDEIGRSFTKLCLGGTLLLYKDENCELPNDYCYSSDVKKYKFKYIETYKLLSSYSDDFIKEETSGVSYLYLKFFEYDLSVIETMLFGTTNTQCNLTERLLLLERIFAPIKTLFIKTDDNLYYIIDSIKRDSETALYDDWALALEKVQVKLHNIVIQLLDKIELDSRQYKIKSKGKTKKKKVFKYLDKLLPLIKSKGVEEIYKFHEVVTFENESTVKHFYLLVLTTKEEVDEMQKAINSFSCKDDNVRFTIIAHSRLFIQRYSFENIHFFENVIKEENIIYSNGYYPAIHWMDNYDCDYSETAFKLDYPISKINKLIKKNIINSKKEGFISTNKLHRCLYIKLQMYVLFHTNYLPNTTNLKTLIDLAIYADNENAPKLSKLFSQLDSFLLTYTQKNTTQKDNNLILDNNIIDSLKQFFDFIDA